MKKPSLSSRAAGERGGSEGSMQNLGTFVLGVDFLWFQIGVLFTPCLATPLRDRSITSPENLFDSDSV